MTTPNSALRAVRMGMLKSQDEFAHLLQATGQRIGEPIAASKRLVQRWESGTTSNPRPIHIRVLQAATGLPIEALGFSAIVPPAGGSGGGGHDVELASSAIAPPDGASVVRPAPQGNYSGVWLSRYEYFSSGRSDKFVGQHYVVVLQHADRLTVRNLAASAGSTLTMDMTIDGNVITGTWVEQTQPDGYYRGARYHGAIQMLVEPTGRRIVGKWVGFGKDMAVNTGPWELVFQDASTNKATLDKYNRQPDG